MKKTIKKSRPFSWMNPKLEVKDTKKYGKGVYAKEIIKKGEMIAVIGGHILTIADENELLKKGGKSIDKWVEISNEFSIGPTTDKEADNTNHININHSCNPNAGFKGQIFLVAMKTIGRDEQINFDYAMCMCSNPKSSSFFRMKCLCGEKKCRGYITEDDWKNPELQKKYNGYFQWYLQEKINKIKNKK